MTVRSAQAPVQRRSSSYEVTLLKRESTRNAVRRRKIQACEGLRTARVYVAISGILA